MRDTARGVRLRALGFRFVRVSKASMPRCVSQCSAWSAALGSASSDSTAPPTPCGLSTAPSASCTAERGFHRGWSRGSAPCQWRGDKPPSPRSLACQRASMAFPTPRRQGCGRRTCRSRRRTPAEPRDRRQHCHRCGQFDRTPLPRSYSIFYNVVTRYSSSRDGPPSGYNTYSGWTSRWRHRCAAAPLSRGALVIAAWTNVS